MADLGKHMPAADLTADRILAFFASERVTKTRSGRTKSPLSVDKTRRVLRHALAWGVERRIADAGIAPAA
jgi:hypothetical protein